MKYPQLVFMPAALQDWLDAELESRGIDAVVYTRYILSLLQKDTLDPHEDSFAVTGNKGQENNRRTRKRSRREEYWNVWDCEQLKRSAAVECLMSASDQKCGIEKLVDELCAKLNHIQSEGESTFQIEFTDASDPTETVFDTQQTICSSPRIQAEKYYAAFPPLDSSSENSEGITLFPETSSVWHSKRVLVTSCGTNKNCIGINSPGNTLENESSWEEENKENQSLENEIKCKEFSKDYAKSKCLLKQQVPYSIGRREIVFNQLESDILYEVMEYPQYSITTDEDYDTESLLRVIMYNKQNSEFCGESLGLAGSSVCSNESPSNMEQVTGGNEAAETDKAEENEQLTHLRLYERGANAESGEADEGYWLDNSLDESSPTANFQQIDESSLKQLVAKFDHNVAALWDQTPLTSISCDQSEYIVVCGKQLSVEIATSPGMDDFLQFISPSGEEYRTVEVYNVSKRGPILSHSFIERGTNITSSIWMQQPQDSSDWMHQSQESLNSCNTESIKDSAENLEEALVNVNGSQVIGYTSNNKEASSSRNSIGDESEESKEEQNVKIIARNVWNKIGNQHSPHFTSIERPWDLGYELSNSVNKSLSSEKLEVKISSSMPEDISIQRDIICNQPLLSTNSVQATSKYSFSTLNHNKEDSSFTEVIPKQTWSSSAADDDDELCAMQEYKGMEEKESFQGNQHYTSPSKRSTCSGAEDEEKEEDLLTSARTHFRPIRHESLEASGSMDRYEDGTTFAIPNSLEKVAFHRSDSGTLYLESDILGLDTPKKYMFFKERTWLGSRGTANSFSEDKQFIPKFQVRQIEKCCQTDDQVWNPPPGNIGQLLKENRVENKNIIKKPDRGLETSFFQRNEKFANSIKSVEESAKVGVCTTATSLPCFTVHTLESTLEQDADEYLKSRSFYCSRCMKGNHQDFLLESLPNYKENYLASKWSEPMYCRRCDNNNLPLWKAEWFQHPSNTDAVEGLYKWGDEIKNTSEEHQSWYHIWEVNPTDCCQHCFSPKNQAATPDSCSHEDGMKEDCSLQCRLREELTAEGEQLFADIHYLQQLYLGAEWVEEGDQNALDWATAEEDGKLQEAARQRCCSESSCDAEEKNQVVIISQESAKTQSVPVEYLDDDMFEEIFCPVELKSKEDFVSAGAPGLPQNKFLFSSELEAEWKKNERPFKAQSSQKDRKRHHSFSQRPCSFYLEGNCRRIHCRFSHDLASVPCRFWEEGSCLKGIACPFLHGQPRPVTL